MKKFLRTLMLAAAMLLPFASHAQTSYLTVADSTATNSYVPVYGLYVDDFVRCQTVYPASMLTGMTGESILGLTYYLSTPAAGSWGVANFVVNVMEVPDTTLSAFVDMTNATTVYTGSLDATQSTMEISFTVPYTYQGGNLLIEIYNTLEGTYKSASFYGKNVTGASWQGNNGTSVANITGSTRGFIPKTTFMYGQPPTCFKVTNLAIDNTQTTTNSLTLIWNDALNASATYTVYDMSDTSVIATGITANTYTVTGLSANASYSFAVSTDCGGGDVTGLTAPVSGRTACAAMALPWTCGFEAEEIQSTTAATALPWCSYRYVSAATSGTTYPYSYSSTTYAHGGSRSLYFYGTTSTSYPDTMTFTLPQVDVTTYPMNGNRLTFWGRSSSASYDKTVYVGTLTDPTDPATYTYVGQVTVTGTTHTLYSIPLTTASATAPYVCITVMRGSGSLYIDDMTLEEMPSCMEVSNLTAGDITSNSVTLTWADNANASATYSVYMLGDDGSLITVATSVADTTYTVTGLNSDTQYTFGVQANCTAGDASVMAVSVRTACDVETMPWSENFDTWTSKSPCWLFLSGAYNGGAGTPTTSTSAWTLNTAYGNYITISGKALTMNIYSTNRYWAVTPIISITSADALLSVDVAVAAWSAETPNYDADDTLAFAISTDGGTTFTNLMVLDNTQLNALSATYTTINVPVVGYNGQNVRFAIFGGSSASGGDNRIAIDNVTVAEAPNCMPVTGLTASNITADSATLSWTGSASSYTIIDLSDSTTVATVTDTFYVLGGLTPMTSYSFGVVANCSGDQSAMVTVSFATACAAVAIPFTEDFETTSTTLGCWSVSNIDANTGIAGGGYAYSGATCFVFSYNTNPPQYLISPELSGTDNGLAVSFMYKVQSEMYPESFQLGYSTTTNDVTAFTWGTEQTNLVNLTYTSYSEILPAGVKYVAIKYTANDMYYLFIDSMAFSMPPSCLPVTNLAVDSTTTTSVFLSWNGTASAYNIYSATGAVVATGVTATNYEVTGLTAMTGYTFGVTAVCGTDESPVTTVNVVTACAGDPCFVEINGADSYGDGWNGNAINVMQAGVLMGTFTVYDSMNSAHITVCSGTPVTLTWNLGMYPDETSFEIKNGVGMIVYTGVGTNLADGDTIIVLSDACPSCQAVSNLTVDSASLTSVSLSWTGTAASYDVYNGTTFVANVTTTNYTFTGLTAATNYTFGVQAVCSATDTADMVTINAATTCADITTLPYYEGFEAGLGCWNTVKAPAGAQLWTINDCTNLSGVAPHGGNYVASSWSWSGSAMQADAWLISPKFVLPNTTDSLTFSWWEATNADYADSYSVAISTTTSDTTAFTVVRPSTAAAGPWTQVSIDLTAYAGQSIYVAFHHVDYDMNYLLIDDISLFQGAYVAPDPDTLTVTFAVNNATMGTTTPAPGTYEYLTGDTVRFSASPTAGHRFAYWVMSMDGENDTIGAQYISAYFPASAFLTSGNATMTMTAVFEVGNPDSTTITYAVNDATMGTTTPAPGTYTIYVGNDISAEATANAGYELNAWVLDIYLDGMLNSSDTIPSDDPAFSNPIVFGTLPQNFADYGATITITAVFAPATVTTYTVIVRTANGEMGNVSPAGINTVNAGESFTVTATPNEGYHFVNWTSGEEVVSTQNPYTFTVNENINLVANFEVNDSTVTYYEVRVISANTEMGTVSSDVAVGQVAEGTVMTVTATANEGYRFLHWVTDGGAVVSTENPYTFTVTENVNLVAMFERIEGIGDVESIDYEVYTVDNRIVVKGVENMPVYVYDVTGRSVKSVAKAAETVEFTVPSAGVYLVKAGMAPAKRVVVVR